MTTVEELRKKIAMALQDDNMLNLEVGTNVGPVALEIAELAIEHFRTIHSRALAAHCECLGMNAENMISAIADGTPPFPSAHYFEVMQKWKLVNEKGEPII